MTPTRNPNPAAFSLPYAVRSWLAAQPGGRWTGSAAAAHLAVTHYVHPTGRCLWPDTTPGFMAALVRHRERLTALGVSVTVDRPATGRLRFVLVPSDE